MPITSATVETIQTHLAWTFNQVLPGSFKRIKREFAHHNYPVLGPLPINGKSELPLQGADTQGPFIYLVVNAQGQVRYVGKSKEKHVLKRWIRPGVGGAASYYWTHSTPKGGCVFNIARGIQEGDGPYQLRFASLAELRIQLGMELGIDGMPDDLALAAAESDMIARLKPAWNRA